MRPEDIHFLLRVGEHSFLASILVLLYFTLIDDPFYFRTKSTPLTVSRAGENQSFPITVAECEKQFF